MILGSFFISTWNHASRIRHFTYIRRTRYHTFKILNFSSQFLISHIIFQRFQFFSLLSKLCYQNIKCTSKNLKHRFNVSIFFSLKNKLICINDIMFQLQTLKNTQIHKNDALFLLPQITHGDKDCLHGHHCKNLGVKKKLFSFETWAGIAFIHLSSVDKG